MVFFWRNDPDWMGRNVFYWKEGFFALNKTILNIENIEINLFLSIYRFIDRNDL